MSERSVSVSDTTETRWFKIVIVVVTGFVIGISIANIVYYNRIRSGTCNAVTQNEANAMFWINIVILVVASLIFLWALWRLLFTRETVERWENKLLDISKARDLVYLETQTLKDIELDLALEL